MSDARILGRDQFAHQRSAGGPVDPRVAATSESDPRVAMVLEVLGGRTAESVAAEWEIEPQIVHRWVRDFLVAGTAAVTNRPDPDEASRRDRFLAAFAHELRTPATVAMGWALELAEDNVPPEHAERAIMALSDSLARLSTSLLDVELAARVSLGRVPVSRELIAVSELAHELPRMPDVRKGADVRAYADPHLLGRILGDLWRTAHRDPAPESVTIDVVETASWTEIRVERKGEPISPMVLRALFDPFGANDDSTGVTMGLYLARALTVAHGGVLGAEGEDDVTVLYTRIPRRPMQQP